MIGGEREEKKKKKAEYETWIFKSGKFALREKKNKNSTVAYVEKQKYYYCKSRHSHSSYYFRWLKLALMYRGRRRQ